MFAYSFNQLTEITTLEESLDWLNTIFTSLDIEISEDCEILFRRDLVGVTNRGGIKIIVHSNDHIPPHFHAHNPEFEAKFRIDTGELIEVVSGSPRGKYLKAIQRWYEITANRFNLCERWNKYHGQVYPSI